MPDEHYSFQLAEMMIKSGSNVCWYFSNGVGYPKTELKKGVEPKLNQFFLQFCPDILAPFDGF